MFCHKCHKCHAMIDLFSTNFQRPEEDESLLAIVERFDGRITAIGPANPDGPRVWVETVRERAVRPRRSARAHSGKPVPEQVENIPLGKFGGYGKPERRGTARPWRLVWSGDGEPLNVGLFDSEEHAAEFRRR